MVEKKEKNVLNILHVDQHHLNVHNLVKVKSGEKQNNDMISLFNILNEAKQLLEDFATTRGKGAEKIANTAKEKGGLAMLTYTHFKVKLPYYKKASEGKLDLDKAKKEYDETYKKISLNMTQTEFQREVGRLEVLGELLIENKK